MFLLLTYDACCTKVMFLQSVIIFFPIMKALSHVINSDYPIENVLKSISQANYVHNGYTVHSVMCL